MPLPCHMVEDESNYQFGSLLKQDFWRERRSEIDNASDIRREHQFPLSRIRRIAKSNEKVERIAADATILLAKACEFFVMELTSQAWFNKEESRCLTLQNWDIGRALVGNACKNFFVHIVHANSQKEAMRHLKETMFPYPLQLQNLNPPQELNLFKENDPSLGNPMHSLSMKPAFLLGNQENLQLFSTPSMSSVPLINLPGYEGEPSESSS